MTPDALLLQGLHGSGLPTSVQPRRDLSAEPSGQQEEELQAQQCSGDAEGPAAAYPTAGHQGAQLAACSETPSNAAAAIITAEEAAPGSQAVGAASEAVATEPSQGPHPATQGKGEGMAGPAEGVHSAPAPATALTAAADQVATSATPPEAVAVAGADQDATAVIAPAAPAVESWWDRFQRHQREDEAYLSEWHVRRGVRRVEQDPTP